MTDDITDAATFIEKSREIDHHLEQADHYTELAADHVERAREAAEEIGIDPDEDPDE